ncbi:MAG: hypothetical protein GXP08_08555 [Gammaproteobacteria bacterium]|nr:hypothetical protein [Gammaproteobacteria bacterium]
MSANKIVFDKNKLVARLGSACNWMSINAFFTVHFQVGRVRQCLCNLLLGGFLVIISTTWAYAREHVVKQEGHQFSDLFLKLENNDVIRFVNLDSVNHKLTFSYKEDKELFTDIGPGASQIIEFGSPGVYDVECHLHPDMKLTVFIPYTYDSRRY